MSGGLAPSKSTVYVSNLPFSLTNSDIHKIFEKHGKVARVTVMKDKATRESKGVAFVLFVDRESAHKAVHAMNRKQLFGRTLKCSIASDNGRASEFIKRRVYKDKSRCYECGEEGHVSYCCPKNSLGDRPQPEKKKKKRKGQKDGEPSSTVQHRDGEEEEDEMEDDDLTLSDAIKMCHEVKEADHMTSGAEPFGDVEDGSLACGSSEQPRKSIKPHSYFSDEDASD
ncbi:hypothetical protein EMCRGX_G002691 [Ephydatia muelleri]